MNSMTEMKKKYNIWHIEGYVGRDDYDGPEDCNRHEDIIFDDRYLKKGVINMWMRIQEGKGYREVVVHSCEIVASGEVEYDKEQKEE